MFLMLYLSDICECCNQGNGGCEHTCTNTIGSYYCACNTGYQLSNNGKHCSGNKIINKIMFLILFTFQISMSVIVVMEDVSIHVPTLLVAITVNVILGIYCIMENIAMVIKY